MEVSQPNCSIEYDHLKVDNNKAIGGFIISEDENYVPMSSPPELNLRLITELEDIDLEPEVERDYLADLRLQYNYLLKWIVDKNFHEHVNENKFVKPDFVCLGDSIAKTLMSPFCHHDEGWKIYVSKFRDIIYLSEGVEKCSNNPDVSISYPTFTNVLNKSRNRTFSVNQFKLGGHHVLTLNEIVGRNDQREYAVASLKKCSKPLTSEYALKLWTKSVVAGAKMTILGSRKEDKLCHVDILPTERISREFEWGPLPCFNFQQYLFDFITSKFSSPETKDLDVKRLTWSAANPYLYYGDCRNPKLMEYILPDWYLKKVENPAPTEIKTPLAVAKNPATIFVGNLHYAIQREDLEKLFSKNGAEIEVRFPNVNEDIPSPYCFVTFQDAKVAEYFIQMEDIKVTLKGGQTRMLHVEPSKSPLTKPRSTKPPTGSPKQPKTRYLQK